MLPAMDSGSATHPGIARSCIELGMIYCTIAPLSRAPPCPGLLKGRSAAFIGGVEHLQQASNVSIKACVTDRQARIAPVKHMLVSHSGKT
jgi:hypothetical protein